MFCPARLERVQGPSWLKAAGSGAFLGHHHRVRDSEAWSLGWCCGAVVQLCQFILAKKLLTRWDLIGLELQEGKSDLCSEPSSA